MATIGCTGYNPLFVFVGYFDRYHAQDTTPLFPPYGYTLPHISYYARMCAHLTRRHYFQVITEYN